MTSGATTVLVFPGRRVQDLLAAYEKALVDSGFEIKQHDWNGQYYLHKAILGSKGGENPLASLLGQGGEEETDQPPEPTAPKVAAMRKRKRKA